MGTAAWRLTNTASCIIYAGVVALRATRHKLNSSLKALSCEWVFMANTVSWAFIELVAAFVEIIINAFECQVTTFCSVGNTLHMHRSMNEVPRSTSTTRFSTILNWGVRKGRHANEKGQKPSLVITSWFTVRCCSNLIDLKVSFPTCSRSPTWLNWGLFPYQVSLPLSVRRLTKHLSTF